MSSPQDTSASFDSIADSNAHTAATSPATSADDDRHPTKHDSHQPPPHEHDNKIAADQRRAVHEGADEKDGGVGDSGISRNLRGVLEDFARIATGRADTRDQPARREWTLNLGDWDRLRQLCPAPHRWQRDSTQQYSTQPGKTEVDDTQIDSTQSGNVQQHGSQTGTTQPDNTPHTPSEIDLPSISHWLATKARLDYSSSTQSLSLRMPSIIHDQFTASVSQYLHSRFQANLARLPDSARAELPPPGQLDIRSSATISLPSGSSNPDSSFAWSGNTLPAFIIECEYSHALREDAAFDLLDESRGRIRTVLVFHIQYQPPEQRRSGDEWLLNFSLFRVMPGEKPNTSIPVELHLQVPVLDDDSVAIELPLACLHEALPDAGQVTLTGQLLHSWLREAGVAQGRFDANIEDDSPKAEYIPRKRKRGQSMMESVVKDGAEGGEINERRTKRVNRAAAQPRRRSSRRQSRPATPTQQPSPSIPERRRSTRLTANGSDVFPP